MALTQVDLALNEDPSKAVFTFRDGAEPGEVAALIVDLTKLGPAEGGDVVVLERLGSEAASRGRSPARTEDPAAAGVRLRGLSPQARIVVEVAAMMAGPFSVSEVADILGQPAGHASLRRHALGTRRWHRPHPKWSEGTYRNFVCRGGFPVP